MNWDQLIIRAIVPISFLAIWALTWLFNQDSRGLPNRPQGPQPSGGPRPVDPTLRWAPPASSSSQQTQRRVPLGDDDILIIPSDPMRPARPAPSRPQQGLVLRRQVKGRQAPPPPRKSDPTVTKTKLSGVNQIVNQSLARPIEMTPLTTITPMAITSSTDLASAPSAPAKTSAVITVSTLMPIMNDPVRLREMLIANELFQPPLALRGRRGHHR